jgi:integrase/recombinase XerD
MARKLPRFLTKPEVLEMFKVASEANKDTNIETRDLILLKSLYYMGLRNSEIQKMLIEDVDIINRLVKVVQGKRGKDRYVPIPEGFANDLRTWIGGRSEGPLFVGRSGDHKMISDRHIRRIVKKYAQMANVRKYEEIHPHTLRHSYATHLQNQGVPLNVIQNMLGHSNIQTTTIYTHMGIDQAKKHINEAFEDFE